MPCASPAARSSPRRADAVSVRRCAAALRAGRCPPAPFVDTADSETSIVKILLVSHRLPFPPDRGGRIRQYQILRHLGRDHDVTLASPLRTDDVAAHVDALRPF